MLMVNSGWQAMPIGQNGESVLVRWSDAFRLLNVQDPNSYRTMLKELFDDLVFPDGSSRSLVYSLAATENEFDLGVRMKSDLLDHLRRTRPNEPSTQAVVRFAVLPNKLHSTYPSSIRGRIVNIS